MHAVLLFKERISLLGLLPLFAVLPFVANTASAQFFQQGDKLVGVGAIRGLSGPFQGSSVALSADGNTAIVGGWVDSSETGAVWIFTRSGSAWNQQGSKLVGSGAVGPARQGISVSLSSDGSTALLGGVLDSSSTGAAWVFTRTNGMWSQQGNKLVGTGTVGRSEQGVSVSLSADGNTALVGGSFDDSLTGAAWVFTRTGNVWSQQGSKLVGTGAVGYSLQGCSVSLSADGNTALVGGYADNGEVGAAWIFTRSGGVWSQQGGKLAGTGSDGIARQGHAVSLSADGNTAILGGYEDNNLLGAAWVFIRTDGIWSQQGSKLVPSDAERGAFGSFHGYSVSLSGDGNTAIVGGYTDSSFTGAAWVYTRTHGGWSQLGNKLVGTGSAGKAEQGVAVDLSTDGSTALVGGFADDNFNGAAWVFSRTVTNTGVIGEKAPSQLRLEQNYPNPFNPTTEIRYQVTGDRDVRLAVYDLLGREVAVLVNGRVSSGTHEVRFHASGLASGVYFYRLTAGDFVATKRLLLLK